MKRLNLNKDYIRLTKRDNNGFARTSDIGKGIDNQILLERLAILEDNIECGGLKFIKRKTKDILH